MTISKEQNLVYEWHPVKGSYLSIGSQVSQIDFGFDIQSDDSLVIENYFTGWDVWGQAFLAGVKSSNIYEFALCPRWNSSYFGQELSYASVIGNYTDPRYKVTFKMDKNVWTWNDKDGNLQTHVFSPVNPIRKTTSNLRLIDTTSTLTFTYHGNIYHISHTRDGILVNDLWPREIDGVAGMYDVVTGYFANDTKSKTNTTYVEPK